MATDTITKSITAKTWAKGVDASGADANGTFSGDEFFVMAYTSDDTAPTDIPPECGIPPKVIEDNGKKFYWNSFSVDDGDQVWLTTIWKDAEIGVTSDQAVADA